MELSELKKKVDKAYSVGQENREKAADDLVFYWITQWDDELLSNVPLKYRGQFDILRKAGRQILSDLRLNPVQPEFHPKDETRTDDADVLDGIYRAADRQLDSQEAYDYASQDAVVCGYGAWELFSEYRSNRAGDELQEIRRAYIPEANNTVFWDNNAKSLDKSGAMWCAIIKGYSPEGYKELVEEMTGEETEVIPSNFKDPFTTFNFNWIDSGDQVYVCTFYEREKVDDIVYTMIDPIGETLRLRQSDIEEVMDEMVDGGYQVVDKKKIKRWEVRKYICSGERILNGEEGERVAGEHIPVVPVYGERAIVQGTEIYEGVTRLAKDPQRLRNFQLSYLQDIVSTSPRPKPIFFPEQVAGFESMYEEGGADSNYPYFLQNRLTHNGEQLPIGPVAQMPEAQVPNALIASINLSREAVEDVANPGLPQNIADPDLSGKAVAALQNRIDQQSYIYQYNFKFAKRRDAQIFASMASEVYDVPRVVTIEQPDGTRKQVKIMETVIDKDTGNPVVINDLTNMEFDVYAEIGQSYTSQKEQTRDRLLSMMQTVADGDPLKNLMMFTLLENTDGIKMEALRDYAHKQMLLGGFKEPSTPEDMQMLQQAQQQGAQPDPNAIAAQGQLLLGQAAVMREQNKANSDALKAAGDQANRQIDVFNAQTKRFGVQIDAAKANADIQNTQADTFMRHVTAASKVQDDLVKRLRGQVNPVAQ